VSHFTSIYSIESLSKKLEKSTPSGSICLLVYLTSKAGKVVIIVLCSFKCFVLFMKAFMGMWETEMFQGLLKSGLDLLHYRVDRQSLILGNSHMSSFQR